MNAYGWNGDDDRDLGAQDPQSHEDDERDNCDWSENEPNDEGDEDPFCPVCGAELTDFGSCLNDHYNEDEE